MTRALEAAAREADFLGFGFYPRSDFMHIELGPKREWGERFAPRPALARETPPARERLAGDEGRWRRRRRDRRRDAVGKCLIHPLSE